jgi:hypothetical protein
MNLNFKLAGFIEVFGKSICALGNFVLPNFCLDSLVELSLFLKHWL